MLYTDEHGAFAVREETHKNEAVKHGIKEFVNEMPNTNGIDSVWVVLKRG